jgi:hypothetical protein
MDWQSPLAWLLVAAAAIYVLRTVWRTWFSASSSCAGSCSCSKASKPSPDNDGNPVFLPASDLTLRRREPGGR